MIVADGAGVTSFKLSMRTHFLSNLFGPDGAGPACQQMALLRNSSPTRAARRFLEPTDPPRTCGEKTTQIREWS